MPHLLEFLADRVLLCDGAMGTQVQARNPDIVRDYLGHEDCTEILTESRPDMIRDIHAAYLAAGSDAIQTNSFGGSPITLGEFGLQDKAFALNRHSAEIAREAVEMFARDGRTRFVLGSLGPGTRLPSLGAAKRRPPRTRRRPHPLPAGGRGAGAMARALRRRGRCQHGRPLLRHRAKAYRRARRDAPAPRQGRLAADSRR